ncbi:MAG: hypothetical protein V4717_17335 [Bacteroidota bacterium]
MTFSLIVSLYLKLAAIATVLLVIALVNTQKRGRNKVAGKHLNKGKHARKYAMFAEPAES